MLVHNERANHAPRKHIHTVGPHAHDSRVTHVHALPVVPDYESRGHCDAQTHHENHLENHLESVVTAYEREKPDSKQDGQRYRGVDNPARRRPVGRPRGKRGMRSPLRHS